MKTVEYAPTPPLGTQYSPASVTDGAGEVSLTRIGAAVLRRWKRLGISAIAAGVLTAGVVLVLPKHYTTDVEFMPVATGLSGLSLGQLSGLASQFGVNLPGQAANQSPDYFVDLIQSSEFLRDVAQNQYSVVDGKDTLVGPFSKLYDIDEGSPGETLDEATQKLLKDIISVQSNTETGTVSVSVSSYWPELSQQIAARVVALVDTFQIRSNQEQAEAQRRFMNARVTESESELRAAENAMQAFLERNRAYQTDPQLSFQHDRLQRDLDTKQAVYTSLLQSYEQARIESARNTPSIALLSKPLAALRADKRHLALKSAIVATLVVLFGGLVAVLTELYPKGREEPDLQEFRQLWAEFTGAMLTPFRRFRRRRRAA